MKKIILTFILLASLVGICEAEKYYPYYSIITVSNDEHGKIQYSVGHNIEYKTKDDFIQIYDSLKDFAEDDSLIIENMMTFENPKLEPEKPSIPAILLIMGFLAFCALFYIYLYRKENKNG